MAMYYEFAHTRSERTEMLSLQVHTIARSTASLGDALAWRGCRHRAEWTPDNGLVLVVQGWLEDIYLAESSCSACVLRGFPATMASQYVGPLNGSSEMWSTGYEHRSKSTRLELAAQS